MSDFYKADVAAKIKEYAASLGFDACGICAAEMVDSQNQQMYTHWLSEGYQADMQYLEKNTHKRFDPRLLVEGTKSIICVALNYYPNKLQNPEAPQFAYYAYGKDYHNVVKAKLQKLLTHIQTLLPEADGRVFCDTAPIMERYWAARAGVGFIGKNSLLIIPQKGSFFFLGFLFLNQELVYDQPLNISCGTCRRCLEACPTQAFEKAYVVNANRCISYQTIEKKGAIAPNVASLLDNRMYGCDECQHVCPWNKWSQPNSNEEFEPSEEFLSLDKAKLGQLSLEEYQTIFKNSAVKRAKYEGLLRNYQALIDNQI